MVDAQAQLDDYKKRFDRLENVTQEDAIRLKCALFIAQCVVDTQQDNRNIQQEVMTSENKDSGTRALNTGGNAGIGGH